MLKFEGGGNTPKINNFKKIFVIGDFFFILVSGFSFGIINRFPPFLGM